MEAQLVSSPQWSSGKQFIEEMNKVVSSFVPQSSLESVSMSMLMIMPALLLQKDQRQLSMLRLLRDGCLYGQKARLMNC